MGRKRIVYVKFTRDEANALAQMAEEASTETFQSTHAEEDVERMEEAAHQAIEKLRDAIAASES